MKFTLETAKLGFLVWFSFGGLVGCSGPEEPDWQYDQADMESAVFGTWTGTITPADEETVPFTLTIRSHDDVARAPACGSRNFSGDDATPGLGTRCITSSSLAVSATVVGDGAESEEADGSFSVFGESLGAGEVQLVYRSSEVRWMRARWESGDVWTSCELGVMVASDQFGGATCTLDERVGATE